MPKNKNYSNNRKSNGYKQQQKRTFENNSRQSAQNPVNEFSSIGSQQAYANYYFNGFNIFDIYSREQLAGLVKDPIGNNKLLRELSNILYKQLCNKLYISEDYLFLQ